MSNVQRQVRSGSDSARILVLPAKVLSAESAKCNSLGQSQEKIDKLQKRGRREMKVPECDLSKIISRLQR